MNYLSFAIVIVALFVGSGIGYYVGMYHSTLLSRIHKLSQPPAPEPEKPTITGGDYAVQKALGNVPDTSRNAGLVETKTPEQLAWQRDEEIKKTALGQ